MGDTKAWYLSKTIWAGVLQVAIGVGIVLGVFDKDGALAIVQTSPSSLMGLIEMAIGAIVVHGRFSAIKKLV